MTTILRAKLWTQNQKIRLCSPWLSNVIRKKPDSMEMLRGDWETARRREAKKDG